MYSFLMLTVLVHQVTSRFEEVPFTKFHAYIQEQEKLYLSFIEILLFIVQYGNILNDGHDRLWHFQDF